MPRHRFRFGVPARLVPIAAIALLAAGSIGFAPPFVDVPAAHEAVGAAIPTVAVDERRPAFTPLADHPAHAEPPAELPTFVPVTRRLLVAESVSAPGTLRPTPKPLSSLRGYRWPLHGRLTTDFGPETQGAWLVAGHRFHDGIDIATGCGDRIVAAHGGRVVAAGRRFDGALGWIGDLTVYYRRLTEKQLWPAMPIVVVIDDGNGYRSIYAHFERTTVKRGQRVRAGQLIGYEGMTGHATGCHLHYGLFSPFEGARFASRPESQKHSKVPPYEIARVDPLAVLPDR
ncbi:MAG: M23 family metallopeptidase [Chloroflexota bacterium]